MRNQPSGNSFLALSQLFLGLMYDKGIGVPQDYTEAIRWYRKGAEQGVAPAQFRLGGMYDNGKGVPQDYAQAIRWYRKAASSLQKSGFPNIPPVDSLKTLLAVPLL